MLEIGGLFLNIFEHETNRNDFNFWLRAHLAYKMNPIKIYNELSNLNAVKISFCKVTVPLIKFANEDIKTTKNKTKKNVKKWLPYQYLSPYNTRDYD